MNNVIIDLGFIQIYWYSIMIFVALLFGGTLAIKEAEKFNIDEDTMIDYFFFLIPLSIIGARAYYVAFNWGQYQNNIVDALKVWNGGLAIHGGILVGLIFTVIYCRIRKIKLFRMTDILAVSLLLGQAIGRWGNFFNQEAHGPEIAYETLHKFIPFDFIVNGMNINGVYYHPTFLYESIWCLLGFIFLLIYRKLTSTRLGNVTAMYFIWYGVGRFFIEGLRTDSLMLGNFKMAQLVSIALIVIGAIILIVRYTKSNSMYDCINEDE